MSKLDLSHIQLETEEKLPSSPGRKTVIILGFFLVIALIAVGV